MAARLQFQNTKKALQGDGSRTQVADGGEFTLKNYLKVWDEYLLNRPTSIR